MTEPAAATAGDRRRFIRELASGAAMVAFLLWLTFFGTAGFVELATLAVAVSLLIWFATVDPARLMDTPSRPSFTLFFLGLLGFTLVLTAALIIGTGTLLFVSALTLASVGVGFSRALAFRYRHPREVDRGVP